MTARKMRHCLANVAVVLMLATPAMAQDDSARAPVSAISARYEAEMARDDLVNRVTLGIYTGRVKPSIIRTPQPSKDFESWLAPEDVPDDFFDARRPWYADAALEITADGSIGQCSLTVSIELDESAKQRVCDLLIDRAHFLYAIDRSGEARANPLQLSIGFFRVPPERSFEPGPPPPIFASQRISKATPVDESVLRLPRDPLRFVEASPSARLEVSKRGRVENCRIVQSSGTDAGDVEICERLRQARFNPATTADGKRVTARTFVRFETQ